MYFRDIKIHDSWIIVQGNRMNQNGYSRKTLLKNLLHSGVMNSVPYVNAPCSPCCLLWPRKYLNSIISIWWLYYTMKLLTQRSPVINFCFCNYWIYSAYVNVKPTILSAIFLWQVSCIKARNVLKSIKILCCYYSW